MATATIAGFDGTLTNLFIQAPLRGDISADLLTGGLSVATGATLEIQSHYNQDIIIFMFSAAASTVTLQEGDYPPSNAAAKGDRVYTIPAGDLLFVIPEADRHTRDADGALVTQAGSIIAEVGGTGPVLFWVYRAPGGFHGIVHTNRVPIPEHV